MLYLFDANVLITASNTYYPIDQIPEFWDWVDHQLALGTIKLPIEIADEVCAGSKNGDPLLDWINQRKKLLVLDESATPIQVQQVLDQGYGTNLNDVQLETIGQDPFLISYCLGKPDRCVVTTEVSQPSKKRQNRKVPDVCKTMVVTCHNPFLAYRTLGFKTSWRPEPSRMERTSRVDDIR